MIEKIKSLIIKILPKGFKDIIRNVLYGKPVDEVSIVEGLFHNAFGSQYTMLDVGAHHGSTCIPFALKDWNVYAFEPDAENRVVLEERRGELNNIYIDSRAVSDESNQTVAFYTSDVSKGISGLSSFHDSHRKGAEVKTIRLDDFCTQHNIQKVDFLKIDTEGYELMVLKSYDWKNQVHPKFIIAEFENRKTLPLGYSLNDMIQYLEEKGYSVLISEWHPIIEYGRTHKWYRFTWDRESITNDRAWGNIIACKAEDIGKLKNAISKV